MAPFPEVTLNRLDFEKHARFSHTVLDSIDGYFDWTYVPSASPFNEQFSDGVHAKYALLKRLFKELRTPEYFVTEDNIAGHLKNMKPYFEKVDLK